jgi:hypothetical protein
LEVRVANLAWAVALTAIANVVIAPPAAAVDGAQDADYNYVGPSGQREYAYWSKPDKRVRMFTETATNMDTDRCFDTKIDWHTGGEGHFDARVLRVCKPGVSVETDPTGNGYWEEDADAQDVASWNTRDINRVREVVSYAINDGNLDVVWNPDPEWSWKDPTDNGVYDHGTAPATNTSWWARVRTKYQDGSVDSSQDNARPYNCPNRPGEC